MVKLLRDYRLRSAWLNSVNASLHGGSTYAAAIENADAIVLALIERSTPVPTPPLPVVRKSALAALSDNVSEEDEC